MSASASQERDEIAGRAAAWVARRDAGLTSVEATELARWRAADARHESAFNHFAGAWSVLDRSGAGQGPDAVLRELQRRTARKRRRHLAVAAVAVLAWCGGTYAWRARGGPEATPRIASTHGGVLLAPETRRLADGSVVELKRGAEISVAFTDRLRRVVLVRGEAHFQVAKNKDRPFAVEAGGLQVRAVGTAFSVQRESQQVEVLVTEGKIAVEKLAPAAGEVVTAPSVISAASPRMQMLATVNAGERISLLVEMTATTAPAVIAVTEAELSERLSWRAPRVEFSSTPLAEAVAMMNRSARDRAAPQLVIDPAAGRLAHEPVSGVFRADNAEAFVRVLELSLGVQVERRGHQLVMRRTD